MADADVAGLPPEGMILQIGGTVGGVQHFHFLSAKQFFQGSAHSQHLQHAAAAGAEVPDLIGKQFRVLQLGAQFVFRFIDAPNNVVR